MKWIDVFNPNDPSVVTLTTATTGLSPEHDEIIAVRMNGVSMYRQNVEADKLLASQEYHKIDAQRLMQYGVPDEDFKEALNNLLGNKIVVSYNPSFQVSFLEPFMEDIPVIWDVVSLYKGAKSGICVEECDDVLDYLAALQKLATGRKGFKAFCEALGLTAVDPALLPLENAERDVRTILNLMAEFQANIQSRMSLSH